MASPRTVEYKTIVGNLAEVQQALEALAPEKWKPMMISASPPKSGPVTITMVLERVIPAGAQAKSAA